MNEAAATDPIIDPNGTVEDTLVDTPDGSIRVRITGRGPIVLCLHGVSAQGRSWLEVARRLRDRATFWIPDMMGRGGSAVGPRLSYSLIEETRRIRELVEALRSRAGDHDTGGPHVIAGHSQGAAVGLSAATDLPGVAGLLLSNPVTPWTARPRILSALESGLIRRFASGIFPPLRRPLATVIVRRAAGPEFRVPRDVVEAYAAPYGDRARAETLMALLRDWRPAELAARLPEGRAVRILAGAFDPRIRIDTVERLADALGAAFTLVPDGGHVLPEQHPELVATELAVLLDGLAADAGLTERNGGARASPRLKRDDVNQE